MAAKKTTKAPKRKGEAIQAELRLLHEEINRPGWAIDDGNPAWVSANTLAQGYVDIQAMPWDDFRDSWLAHGIRRCAKENYFDDIKILLCRLLREAMRGEDADRVEAVRAAVFKDFSVPAEIPGRKPGIPIDGAKLKTYRKRIKISQEKLAEECKLAVATIQKAERGLALDSGTLDVIVKKLRGLGQIVTAEDLTKTPTN